MRRNVERMARVTQRARVERTLTETERLADRSQVERAI
jgi:hypothetical protein